MIVLHVIYLLLSLATATPILREESPSSPLYKRDIECIEQNGRDIIPFDCGAALRAMRQHLAFNGPVSGPFEPVAGPFSRQPSDVRYQVPIFFRTPTCTIAIDTISVTASLPTRWSTKVATAQAILNRCVAPQTIGGETRTSDGFFVMVVNERTLTPTLRSIWSACLRIGLRVDIAMCAGRLGSRVRQYATGR